MHAHASEGMAPNDHFSAALRVSANYAFRFTISARAASRRDPV